jgi:hypothetical protein
MRKTSDEEVYEHPRRNGDNIKLDLREVVYEDVGLAKRLKEDSRGDIL